MPIRQDNTDSNNGSGTGAASLMDLFRSDIYWNCRKEGQTSTGPRGRLENFLGQSGNNICADCGSPDPKWVSISLGVFICIKCSGVHRSLGVHISKVLSVKLDEWTDEQVDTLTGLGGNNGANMKYEASIPDYIRKPRPDSSIEDRSDYIRRKYEMHQFFNSEEQLFCPFPSQGLPSPPGQGGPSSSQPSIPLEKRHYEKQTTSHRLYGLGQAFRNSWRKKDPEHKAPKKSSSSAGMIEFVGLIKVNVVKGTNLAVRDVMTSDPYVLLTLGQQSVKTRVIKNNLNPVWNERLMLSIPEQIPPLRVIVYDKDTFSTDDFMGEAEIDIQPLVSAAIAHENSTLNEPKQLGKWEASKENTLVKDSIITLTDGKVIQEVSIKLQNVERGVLEITLECVPLSQ